MVVSGVMSEAKVSFAIVLPNLPGALHVLAEVGNFVCAEKGATLSTRSYKTTRLRVTAVTARQPVKHTNLLRLPADSRATF